MKGERITRPMPKVPLRAAIAEEFARQHAWRVKVETWGPWRDARASHTTITALNVDFAKIDLMLEHGFKPTSRVSCVGGPRRSGPRVNMRMQVEHG